jgi:hypothetical protein
LWSAYLKGADLSEANLQGADLRRADLQRAQLWRADLQRAQLDHTNLQGAIIIEADLKDCFLYNVINFPIKNYEPKAGATPYIPSIAEALWLKDLSYENKVHGLVDLREGFKRLGYRKQERQITYAIKHTGFIKARSEGDLPTKIEAYLGWFFFELTCQWGMAPERPLFILIGFIFLFTFIYGYAISAVRYSKDSKDGVYKVWLPDRIRDDLGNPIKELLNDFSYRSLWLGFRFSILSAFHFGWRDLNVGNWIVRLQPYEYKLQAAGWPRTVSGIQSLISVYLLALSVLTYFGRPFESY